MEKGPTQIPPKPPSFSTSPARVFSTRVMHIVHDLCALIALPVIHHGKRWAFVLLLLGVPMPFFAFFCFFVCFFAHARVLPLVPLLCASSHSPCVRIARTSILSFIDFFCGFPYSPFFKDCPSMVSPGHHFRWLVLGGPCHPASGGPCFWNPLRSDTNPSGRSEMSCQNLHRHLAPPVKPPPWVRLSLPLVCRLIFVCESR